MSAFGTSRRTVRLEFSVAIGGAADMAGRAAQPETDANDPKRTSADCRLKGMSARFKPAILSQLAWWTKALKAARQQEYLATAA